MLRITPLIVLLALAACQTRTPAGSPNADAFSPAPPAADIAADPTATVEIAIRLLTSSRPHTTVAALEADPSVEELSAPRIMVRPHERGSLSVTNEQAYISRFDIERTDEHMVADPVVEVLQTGIMIEIAPHPTADGRWTGLVKFSETRINELAEADLALAASSVTVQLPDVTTWSVARVLEPSAAGRWVLNLGQRGPGEWRLIDIAMAPGPAIDAEGVGRPGK